MLALPAGALIDRSNRKRVMIGCDLVRALALGSIPLAAAFGQLEVIQLYGVALVVGSALVFFNIAQTAALTHVVAADQLPQATAAERTVAATAELIGPGLAGMVITLGRTTAAGAVGACALDSVSYVASALALSGIRVPFQGARSCTAWHAPRRDGGWPAGAADAAPAARGGIGVDGRDLGVQSDRTGGDRAGARAVPRRCADAWPHL